MAVRRLGQWLAILAIALHAAWPLIANAKPKSVHLVPLCTVEGITHYVEVPGGGTPLDDSANAHRDHCSFCFLGSVGVVTNHVGPRLVTAAATELVAFAVEHSHSNAVLIVHGARAPPLSPVVNNHHNFRRQSETNLLAGRVARAAYS